MLVFDKLGGDQPVENAVETNLLNATPLRLLAVPEPRLEGHFPTSPARSEHDVIFSDPIYQEVQANYQQAEEEGWAPGVPVDRCMVGLTVMLVMSRIDDLMNMSWGTPQAALAALRSMLT